MTSNLRTEHIQSYDKLQDEKDEQRNGLARKLERNGWRERYQHAEFLSSEKLSRGTVRFGRNEMISQGASQLTYINIVSVYIHVCWHVDLEIGGVSSVDPLAERFETVVSHVTSSLLASSYSYPRPY
jgi:hypothetical protein